MCIINYRYNIKLKNMIITKCFVNNKYPISLIYYIKRIYKRIFKLLIWFTQYK